MVSSTAPFSFFARSDEAIARDAAGIKAAGELLQSLHGCRDGFFYLCTTHPDRADASGQLFVRTEVHHDPLLAAHAAIHYDAQGFNVYYTPGTYREATTPDPKRPGHDKPYRQARNFLGSRVLFVDIDVAKPDAYADADTARDALAQACRAIGIQTPGITVASGGGLHGYWVLDTLVESAHWRSLATSLARAFQGAGLRFDPQCTVSPTQLLRVPGTRNHKIKGQPRPVAITGCTPGPIAVQTMRQALLAAVGPTPEAVPDPGFHTGYDGWSPASAAIVEDFCAQMRASLASGGSGDREPLWRGLLSIAKGTTAGLDLARRLSQDDPRFSQAELAEKYNAIAAPYTCDRLDLERGGLCCGCPVFGLIGSPLQLDPNRRALLSPALDAARAELVRVFLRTRERSGADAALAAVVREVRAGAAFIDTLAKVIETHTIPFLAHEGIGPDRLKAVAVAAGIDAARAVGIASKWAQRQHQGETR
jgi:hypothetical protein